MPELPEVRTVASYLNKNVAGLTIKNVIVNVEKLVKEIETDDFINRLKNKKILSVSNIGKFLIFNLSNEQIIISHLRMVGKYRIVKKPDFEKHDHVIFKLNNNSWLVYNDARMFGTFYLRTKEDYLLVNPIKKLGKESNEIDRNVFLKKLSRKTIAIKTALLDQTLVLGLGNIYVNEALYASKVNPYTPSNKITKTELNNILKKSYKIMEDATSMGGTTIHNFESFNKIRGNYQDKLKVHGKNNTPCKRCGNNIIKTKVNGRGTYWCSHCQNNWA